MTAPSPAKRARPLSPHLQIYRWQLPMASSIFHRMTGVALCFALPVLVTWLLALSRDQSSYEGVMGLLASPVGQVFLAGWTFCFFYHLCNGIRHLLWDTGRLLELKDAYGSGYIAISAAFILTAIIWLVAYGVIG